MSDSFTLTTYVPASPLQVYTAWLDGEQHSEMTGGRAHCEPVVGAAFDSWDGYIRGTNLELEPGRRILQSWRSTEFPDDAPDSRVELTLQADGDGTQVLLRHWDIPPGQGGNYERGWQEHYFSPMRQYFESRGTTRIISADEPAPAVEWERPSAEEEVDDWSSTSEEAEHAAGWEAPIMEEIDDQPESRPITLEAERPFLEPPKTEPVKADAPAPKQPAKEPAKEPAKKPAEKPAKKAARRAARKAAGKPKKVAKKKPAKKTAKKSVKKGAKKKTTKSATKTGARKAVKKKASKKAPKKVARKSAQKPAGKKTAKRKPAKRAGKKKVGKKPARKSPAKKATRKARKATKRPAKKAARKSPKRSAKGRRR